MNNSDPVETIHPEGFTLSRWIPAETINDSLTPDLAPFFAAGRDVDHLIGCVPLIFDEVRDEDGNKYLCGITHPEGLPMLALKWSEGEEEPHPVDYMELFDVLGLPRPNPLAVAMGMSSYHYGDTRPINERVGMLADFQPIEHPDGNRLAVLMRIEKHGLLSISHYIGAMLGWQADFQPAANADIGAMFSDMMGGHPPHNPLGGLFR